MTGYGIINLILTGASEHGGFNWQFVMEHAVNLIILLGVLVYFLKTPVKNFLVERRGSISHEIDTAQKTIGEAKTKYEEYAKKLQAIESEINALKETLRKQGETERAELLKQAESASETIRKEARETIALQTERARREIQTEVVNLALGNAEALIKQSLQDADKERFIQEFTKNIEDEKWHQSQH
jgi:F-type H+-transporting ATPase subunit b